MRADEMLEQGDKEGNVAADTRSREGFAKHESGRALEPLGQAYRSLKAVVPQAAGRLDILGDDPLHVRDPRLPPAKQPTK